MPFLLVRLVSLTYWATVDILEADSLIANVSEGQTTGVQFFSPARRENLIATIVEGDGSEDHWQIGTGTNANRKSSNVNTLEPEFRVSLEVVDGQVRSYPTSDWLEASQTRNIVLSDVGRGHYRLVVDVSISFGNQIAVLSGRIAIRHE
jgi:hypothetical protein